MATKYDCHSCKKQVAKTKNDRYRSHSGGDGEPCEQSSAPIPEHVLAQPVGADDAPDVPRKGVDYAECLKCGRNVKLTKLGYFEPHATTLMGADRCENGGVRAKHQKPMQDRLLPGDGLASAVPKVRDSERPVANRGITSPAPTSTSAGAEGTPSELPSSSGGSTPKADLSSTIDWSQMGDLKHLGVPADSPASTGSSGTTPTADRPVHETNLERQPMGPPLPEPPSLESTSTSPDSPAPEPDTSSDAPGPPEAPASVDEGPLVLHLAPLLDDVILQPFSHIFQPFPVPIRVKMADAMTDRGKEIATRLRETFYAYTNRNAKDNRSAQVTLGPSEIGSPCDRQIAMKLLQVKPTNPQEGWAPFVGTAVHAELAKMFEWANGSGSGRYITEMPLSFGNELVPYGTGDLFDRTMCLFLDHKLMGRWSLDKLIQNGPSETYRIQVQVYGLGAERAGEKVKEVAIIGWPRQESSLDKLYVHVEKYDRKVAEAALERVGRIAENVQAIRRPDGLGDTPSEMATAQQFETDTQDSCRWCPFHLKGDKEMKRGCPGASR